jgi:membrane protease YdiL (CAAX protease family)
MTSTSALRPVLVYLGTAFSLALGIAVALPHMGLAALLSALIPIIGVAVAITVTVRPGERRAAWSAVGLRRPPLAVLALALALPAVITFLSFASAWLLGIIHFSAGLDLHATVQLAIALFFGSFLFLGEEIGWRGFLYPRLAVLLPRKRAALVTGAFHAAFHLPLLLLTSIYQFDGNRLIVVPMVMVTITAAGVVYAWVNDLGRSVWPVSVMHNAFNTFMETTAGLSVAGSAATLAYATTETGIFTLLIVVGVAGLLLTRLWPSTLPSAGVQTLADQDQDQASAAIT